MNSKNKKDWTDYYTIGCFLILSILGVNKIIQNSKDIKTKSLEQKTQVDSMPQVTNYKYIPPLIPIYNDPLKNVYNLNE